MIRGITPLAVLLLAPAALAGSYGTVSESHAGFTLSAEVGVGSYVGPDAADKEQADMDRLRSLYKRKFARVRGLVKGAIKHYHKARHGWRGLAHLVDRKARSRGARTPVARVGLARFGGGIDSGGDLLLHLRGTPHQAVRARIASDFVLAQTHRGGKLGAPTPWVKLDSGSFADVIIHSDTVSHQTLRFVHAHRATLIGLAEGDLEMPKTDQEDRLDFYLAVWVDHLRGTSPSAARIEEALELGKGSRRALRLIIALTPTAELAALRKRLQSQAGVRELMLLPDLDAVLAALKAR